MPRWSQKESDCIAHVRERLKDAIEKSPNYPEVIGDRKIVRFLRGHDYNLEKVCELMRKFLQWRIDNHVNDIRKSIVEGEADHPLKFPKGELILQLVPGLVLAPDAVDTLGSPICVDQYNFSPSDVLTKISLAEYILFVTHVLEYRSLIVEQMSEEREQAYLSSLSPEEREAADLPDSPPYGVIVNTLVIRDMTGIGFDHLGSKGQEIMKAVIGLASDNYPELMRKCYMINTPWVFQTVWYFVQGLLAARTIAKIAVLGSDFKGEIQKEVAAEFLPKCLGGPYVGYAEYKRYPFNLEYLCAGCEVNGADGKGGASSSSSEADGDVAVAVAVPVADVVVDAAAVVVKGEADTSSGQPTSSSTSSTSDA